MDDQVPLLLVAELQGHRLSGLDLDRLGRAVTGLKKGTYIIEELSSDGDHVVDTPPQTVYLSGQEQEVIQVYFGNSAKGAWGVLSSR